MVAGLEVVHVGAHALHDAGALMAQHQRQRDGHSLRAAKLVGVADARGDVAHEDLVVLRLVQLDVLHTVGTILLVHDQSLDSHACPPNVAWLAGAYPAYLTTIWHRAAAYRTIPASGAAGPLVEVGFLLEAISVG